MQLRLLSIFILIISLPVKAVDLELAHSALERTLAAQLFSGDGRRYVRGSPQARCSFAYLERPSIRGESGRLLIRARFTGRSALDLFGRCVGMGDAFDVKITASPYYKDGAVMLRDVSAVPENGGGFYARAVCNAMSASLTRDFRFALAAEAKKVLEEPASQPGFKRELKRFSVSEIRVTSEALVLVLDFALAVR